MATNDDSSRAGGAKDVGTNNGGEKKVISLAKLLADLIDKESPEKGVKDCGGDNVAEGSSSSSAGKIDEEMEEDRAERRTRKRTGDDNAAKKMSKASENDNVAKKDVTKAERDKMAENNKNAAKKADAEDDDSFMEVVEVPNKPKVDRRLYHEFNYKLISDFGGSWEAHVTASITRAQESSFIAHHHKLAATAVKFFLIEKDMIVVERTIDKTCCDAPYHAIRVTGIRADEYTGVCLSDTRCNMRYHTFTKVVRLAQELEEALTHIPFSILQQMRGPHFYDIKLISQSRIWWHGAVCLAIQKNMKLEIQLEEAPHLVCVGEVVENYRGMLTISVGVKSLRMHHMFSPLLHELGWGHRQNRKVGDDHLKIEYFKNYLCEMDDVGVPGFVFQRNVTYRHRLDFTHGPPICVVLDEKQNRFYYAHVEEAAHNEKHYFHLVIGDKPVMRSWRDNHIFSCQGKEYFHIYHHRIFSFEIARDMNVKIHLPTDDMDLKRETKEMGLNLYKRLYLNGEGHLMGREIGAHSAHLKVASESQGFLQKVDRTRNSLKYVEIFRETGNGPMKLLPAAVIYHLDCVLWLKIASEVKPVFTHMCDPNLFHFGANKDMGIIIDEFPDDEEM